VVFDAQGRNGSGALFDAIKGCDRAAQFLGPVRPFESSECCVRSSGTYAAVPLEDLLEVDRQEAKTSHASSKLTTELDADQSSFSLVRLT